MRRAPAHSGFEIVSYTKLKQYNLQCSTSMHILRGLIAVYATSCTWARIACVPCFCVNGLLSSPDTIAKTTQPADQMSQGKEYLPTRDREVTGR